MAETEDPRPAFDYALAHYPHRLQVTVLADVLLSSSRAKPTLGKPASVEIAVTDEQVVNLKGDGARRDLVLMVRIPRDVVDRSRSAIILPGEE